MTDNSLALGPIGVFDSGIGGLSVWREIVRQFPAESTVYLADQAQMPYGSRSLAQVQAFSEAITRFLLSCGAKIIVVACNTASAAALLPLRQIFPQVAFVGMEPAVKPAVERTRSGIVGVLATQATFQGQLFANLTAAYAHHARVLTQVGWGLAQAVEAGELDTPATQQLLAQQLAPLLAAGIDQLVLGCTHYPFLRPAIERVLGPEVAIIDPAPAVARQTGRVLAHYQLQNSHRQSPRHVFYTTGHPHQFTAMLDRLLPGLAPPAEVRALLWRNGWLAHTEPVSAGSG